MWFVNKQFRNNVINNVDSEIENLSWRKKFRFHNRKLLKFGIFERKTSIVSSRGNLTLFHIICDSEIELKTHYFENAYEKIKILLDFHTEIATL